MDRLYKSSNRYKFIESLKDSSTYYIVCIDIIDFKNINNKFGFHNGDVLLSQIIDYINQVSNDGYTLTVCRYESDIIMVKMECTSETDILKFVNKITTNKYIYNVKFRIGYKKIDKYIKVEHFLDGIMYVIKNKKYTIEEYINKSNDLSIDIEKYFAVKSAIRNNRTEDFKMVYQPKILNSNKMIDSCEVLTRWSSVQTGDINTDEFLSIIKSLNKEIDFDLMIFEKACKEISTLKGIIDKFSINVSIKSILNYKFLDEIYNLVRKYNLNTQNITLEILEDICECNYIQISNNIDKLVKLGFCISIDDFGTGYSSYFRLSELNFSEVKIPREFLILENNKNIKKNKKILHGIVNLCKSLDCKIVIEGVETEESLILAELLNIDYIQGYYYSKPLNKKEYIEFKKEYKMGFN